MKLSLTLLATTAKCAPERNAPITNIGEMAEAILDGSGKNGFRADDATNYGCAGRGWFEPFAPTAGKQVDETDKAFYAWKKCVQCAVGDAGVDDVQNYNYDKSQDSCGKADFLLFVG